METITSDDILGKMALDPSGDIVGIITEIHIDKNSKLITGISVDQGFMKPSLFIGLNHIQKFGVDAIFLKKIPFEKIKGLNILNYKGDFLGFVDDVIIKRHKIKEIVAKKSKMSQEFVIIPSAHIKEVDNEIILKKGFGKKLWKK